MAEVTVTEYETTEKNITRYECDECKSRVDEDDICTALITRGDESSGISRDTADESKHLCEDCIGLGRALEIREKKEYLKARWEGFRGYFDYLVLSAGVLAGGSFVGGLLMAMGIVEVFAEGTPLVAWAIHGFAGIVLWSAFTLVLLLILVPEPDYQ